MNNTIYTMACFKTIVLLEEHNYLPAAGITPYLASSYKSRKLNNKKEVLTTILLIFVLANGLAAGCSSPARMFIVRRRRKVFFCLFCDVPTELFCHLQSTFSDENRAYLLFFCVMVGMFSSFFLEFGSAKVHIIFDIET